MTSSRSMRSFLWGIAAVVTLTCIGCHAPGQGSACVTAYSHASYHAHRSLSVIEKMRGVPQDVTEDNDLRTGAAFSLAVGERRYIVTAAHVIARRWAEGEAAARALGGNLTAASVRVRVSSLAYAPTRWLVDHEADLAILEMPPGFWEQLNLQIFNPRRDLPRLGDELVVWGFPGTAVPQLQEGAKVVMAHDAMLVLNCQLLAGFSGGPAIDKQDGNVQGMVLRTDKNQSRVLPMGKILEAIEAFEQRAVAYIEPVSITK